VSFRRLHEQYLERHDRAEIERAGRWAFEQGGNPESISEAVLRFFGGGSPDLCERIRKAMPSGAAPEPPAKRTRH